MSQRFWHGNGIFNECLKDSVALIWFSTTQLIYPIILYHRKSAKCNVRVQESVAGIRLDRKVQSAKCNFRRVLHTSPPDLTRATLSWKRTLHFALLRGGGITLLKPGSVIHSSNRTRGTLSSVKPEYLSGQTVSPKKTPLAFNWNRLLPIWSHWNL